MKKITTLLFLFTTSFYTTNLLASIIGQEILKTYCDGRQSDHSFGYRAVSFGVRRNKVALHRSEVGQANSVGDILKVRYEGSYSNTDETSVINKGFYDPSKDGIRNFIFRNIEFLETVKSSGLGRQVEEYSGIIVTAAKLEGVTLTLKLNRHSCDELVYVLECDDFQKAYYPELCQ